MNSSTIMKLLNRLVNDPSLNASQLSIIHQVIQHVKIQDQEMLELKEDVTDVAIPENQS